MTEHNPAPQFGLVPPDIALTLTGLEFLRGLVDRTYPAPPFAEIADIWPVLVEHGRIVFEGMPSRRFYNPMGIVHGGWAALVLDTVMGCAVQSALAAGRSLSTIDMSVTYVRRITEHTGKIRAEGRLLNLGGRVGNAEGKLFDEAGKLLAYGSESCSIVDFT